MRSDLLRGSAELQRAGAPDRDRIIAIPAKTPGGDRGDAPARRGSTARREAIAS
jgi:hypothetical protein